MKYLKLFSFLLLGALIVSCGDDEGGSSDTFWECTIDGESFKAEGVLAYAVRFDVDNTISVYGSEEPNASGYRNMFISTKDEGNVGNYDLSLGGQGVGTLLNTNGNKTFISGLEGGSGSMEITSIDGEYVEGTFSFIGTDLNGGSKEIKDGRFKVKFQ